ncbi:MAG: YdcF family protein [Elainellaceae cyanobacterium]
MPELLTRILLLAIVAWLFWYVVRVRISDSFLVVLGGVALVALAIVAFQNPNDQLVGPIWNVLSFPFKPLGLSILLLAIALRKGLKAMDSNLVAWALAVLWIFSTPLVAYWLVGRTQETAEQLAALNDQGRAAEVIVVLGDGLNPSDPAYRGGTQLNNPDNGFGNSFVSRLQYAAQLYQEQLFLGVAPLVIVSPGPQITDDSDEVEENVIRILAAFGVPPEQVVVDENGVDMRTSSDEVALILSRRDFEETGYSVLLVAPANKVRRARSTFADSLGVLRSNVIPAPTDFYGFQTENEDLLMRLGDLLPTAEALNLSSDIIEEYLATLYYFLRGWLYAPIDA